MAATTRFDHPDKVLPGRIPRNRRAERIFRGVPLLRLVHGDEKPGIDAGEVTRLRRGRAHHDGSNHDGDASNLHRECYPVKPIAES
jgi:hypothetical protein